MIRIQRYGLTSETRTFDSLGRARHYAQGQVGPRPDIVADDFGTEYAEYETEGVKVTIIAGGCHIRELFPALDAPTEGA